MAEYSVIRGFNIPAVASDPSNLSAGEIWYNSTSTSLKGYGAQGTGAWAAGGLLNAMTMQMGTAGTQTAALSFGGTGDPGLRKTNESYNGTAWTELADMLVARQGVSGLGTQTAAMGMGGLTPSVTNLSETWDGNSWTEGNNVNTARDLGGGAGTTTAGLYYGGNPNSAATEEYDGTSWSEVNDLNNGRDGGGSGGLQSTAMYAGGHISSPTVKSEIYDGTSWSETGDLNTTGYGGAYSGDSSAGILGGRVGGTKNYGEEYNGSTWTSVASLARGRYYCNGAPQGSVTAGICIGGQGDSAYPGTASQSVEEWAIADATKTFTAS